MTGEAGIDTTHSLSRSGGNIQCLVLTLFIYKYYHCKKIQATKVSEVQQKCIIRLFTVQDWSYSPVPAESLVVEERLMMNDWCQRLRLRPRLGLGQLYTFLRQFGSDSRHHWVPTQVSANHSSRPSLHCEIWTNQKTGFQRRSWRDATDSCWHLCELREKTLT